MNQQQKIIKLENKIQEIKNLLKNWVQEVTTYHQKLEVLTNQLNEIKTKSTKYQEIRNKYEPNK